MKKIWKYLKVHWSEDFSVKPYLSVAILLALLITINYVIDFEDTILDSKTGFVKFLFYFGFYALPYYTTVALTCTNGIWRKHFVFKSLFALIVLSLDASVPFLRPMLVDVDVRIYVWLYKVVVNLISLITVLLPLLLYYAFVERDRAGFYGLVAKRFDYAPYLQMLLLMLPLLIAATFLPGFLKQYPMYKTNIAHEYLGVHPYVTAMTYELAYGLDFVTVELFFRGFMVIGMASLMGRKAVLSMAVIYCLLHFGKPAGEALSSILGGYVLGVIAYETRSIWGGIIVHVGIAWTMELVSFIAKEILGRA